MRVADDSCIMQEVRTWGVRQQSVQKDNISLLRHNYRELLELPSDICPICCLNGWVQTFWTIVQEFDNACHTILGNASTTASLWDVSEDVYNSQRIAGRIEEHPVLVIVTMPAHGPFSIEIGVVF